MNRNAVSLFFICFYFLFNSCSVCENFLDDEIRPQLFSGRVIEKYQENPDCFGGLTIQDPKDKQTLPSINYCRQDSGNLWDDAQIGDSIYKPKGSVTVTLFKKDTVLIFDYPCIVM